jgi:hypothetical protein
MWYHKMLFIDHLSMAAALQLIPILMWRRIFSPRPVLLRYFTATAGGRRTLELLTRIKGIAVEEADYSFVDILDANGALDLERARLKDPLPVCRAARLALWENSLLLKLLGRRFDRSRMLLYLEKAAEEKIALEAIRIGVVSWFLRNRGGAEGSAMHYFVARTPWQRQVKEYAAQHGVVLKDYRSISIPRRIPGKALIAKAIPMAWRLLNGRLAGEKSRPSGSSGVEQRQSAGPKPPFTVAVHHFGNGLTLDPGKNSDLFWAPHVGLEPDQLLVYATRGDDPLDEDRYAELRDSSIQAVATRKAAQGGPRVPVWPSTGDMRGLLSPLIRNLIWLAPCWAISFFGIGSARWTGARLTRLVCAYVYWSWFFSSFKVKVHVDYGDWAKHRIASDLALADLGGISVGYQRSYEAFPSLQRASAVDVHFSFGTDWARTERESHSLISYYVANGYIHDHAFAYVKDRAAGLRTQLAAKGAQFIICLLDENSFPDKRGGQTDEYIAQDYKFLLDRLLEDPGMGLIFKPKKPGSLRHRLGPVSDLLDTALKTGRCYMHTQGIVATDMLPCEAGAASDLTIALLYGSTAALEVALHGTPTVMLDRELQTNHPLYALGEGRVIFKDWDVLWDSLSQYRAGNGGTAGFGDWRPTLDELDEFQDGKAAQRMGEYISWLVGGLAKGLKREKAMELAQRKYTDMWGIDKVVDLRQEGDPEMQLARNAQSRSAASG